MKDNRNTNKSRRKIRDRNRRQSQNLLRDRKKQRGVQEQDRSRRVNGSNHKMQLASFWQTPGGVCNEIPFCKHAQSTATQK